MYDFACVIDDRELRASSLLVKADNQKRSQKIQLYTVNVPGWQKRALWTGTALAAGYTGCHVRDHESIRVGVANLLPAF